MAWQPRSTGSRIGIVGVAQREPATPAPTFHPVAYVAGRVREEHMKNPAKPRKTTRRVRSTGSRSGMEAETKHWAGEPGAYFPAGAECRETRRRGTHEQTQNLLRR